MKSSSQTVGLAPVAGKQYKVFLVEVDDEDRERVLSGLAGHCEIEVEPQYAEVHSEFMGPVARFVTSTDVTCTLKLVPREDGTYFRIEDFSESDPYEDDGYEPFEAVED